MRNCTTITVEIDQAVATLWLNRPEKHNALNPLLMNEVIQFFNDVELDKEIRFVVIRGKGKSFCAGADLGWMKESALLNREENLQEGQLLTDFFTTIYNSSKVTIGIAHGNIFGGGNGLLAVCDLAYSISASKFSLSETRLGLIAATITPFMLRKLQPSVYKELIFTARAFNGTEAERIGMVNKNFDEAADLDEHLKTTLSAMMNAGPQSLIGSKKLINDLLDISKHEEIKKQLPEIIANVRVTDEAKEGFAAFLEKRLPKW
jgi:methylglutaconyl-CoA hydratase